MKVKWLRIFFGLIKYTNLDMTSQVSLSQDKKERERERIIIINLKKFTDRVLESSWRKRKRKRTDKLKGVALRLTIYFSKLSVETRSQLDPISDFLSI